MRLSLFALYASTLCIRIAAYMIVGIAVSSEFLALSDLQRGLIIPLFSASEIATVLGFGTLCDTMGRRQILILAHVIVAIAGFLFVLVQDFMIMIPLMLAFGVGAAAQVASSLATISDHSKLGNRARLMAFFDMFTMGGLAGGYMAAIILTRGMKLNWGTVFAVAGALAITSGILVFLFMIETRAVTEKRESPLKMIRSVFSQKDLLLLLPVYIPVISIYGMVLSFTRSLIEKHNIQVETNTLLLLAAIGGGLLVSMLVSGYLSDRRRVRRPFIIVGLICFGALASILLLNASDIANLYPIWYLVLALSFGAGAFPPAILAYLSDISKRETRGITFGVYSMIFGTGMIIGPILGGAALQFYGQPGFITLMFVFVAVSCAATLAIKERVEAR